MSVTLTAAIVRVWFRSPQQGQLGLKETDSSHDLLIDLLSFSINYFYSFQEPEVWFMKKNGYSNIKSDLSQKG